MHLNLFLYAFASLEKAMPQHQTLERLMVLYSHVCHVTNLEYFVSIS